MQRLGKLSHKIAHVTLMWINIPSSAGMKLEGGP
jgi:hypothetical protein